MMLVKAKWTDSQGSRSQKCSGNGHHLGAFFGWGRQVWKGGLQGLAKEIPCSWFPIQTLAPTLSACTRLFTVPCHCLMYLTYLLPVQQMSRHNANQFCCVNRCRWNSHIATIEMMLAPADTYTHTTPSDTDWQAVCRKRKHPLMKV